MLTNLEWGLIGVVIGYAISDGVHFITRQIKLRRAKALLKITIDLEKQMKEIEDELSRRKEDNDNDVFK